jgi:hypothetical protein
VAVEKIEGKLIHPMYLNNNYVTAYIKKEANTNPPYSLRRRREKIGDIQGCAWLHRVSAPRNATGMVSPDTSLPS